MLTISLDRVAELLNQAADVELPVTALAEDSPESTTEHDDGSVVALVADDPAYQALRQAVEALSPNEAYDLLALALLERHSAELDEWQAMLERARETPEETVGAKVVQALVLSDDIECALSRLGYDLADSDEENEEAPAEDTSEETAGSEAEDEDDDDDD